MHQQIKRHEDVFQELNEVKAKLSVSERDRKRAFEELKRAMEAEENKKKAMEDLALALKEVAAECSATKEKLIFTERQLDAVKEEATNLKKMVKCTEETYEALFKEQKKETDRLINIVNRLRLEAEESVLAWSCKEMEFVNCIKKTEDDRNVVQAENSKLMQSLKEAQESSVKSKEETNKLRDILKQALNEANVAKEAASLARTENSFLKDSLAEKDKALFCLPINDQDKDDVDTLGGSIFDLVDSPEKEPPPYYRRTSSACSDAVGGTTMAFQNFDDMEIERRSHGKKKALLRRFGDLLKGKTSHPPKDLPPHPPAKLK